MALRVLITGGAGFIGYHLARHYALSGAALTIIDDLRAAPCNDAALELTSLGNVTFLQRDIASAVVDMPSVTFDLAFHLAATVGVETCKRQPHETFVNTLQSTLDILQLARSGRLGKLVFTSSSEVYADTVRTTGGPLPTPESVALSILDPTDPRSAYAAGKICGELCVRHYAALRHTPFVIVRLHNVYGPRMGFRHVIPQVLRRALSWEDPFRVITPHSTRAFTYVDDAVRALVALANKVDNEIVNVGSPVETTTLDLYKAILAQVGYSPTLVLDDDDDPWVPRRCPDVTVLQRLTGYVCATPLSVGLDATCAWYLKRARNKVSADA